MPDTQDINSDALPLCEMRFDIPLTTGRGNEAQRFERAWRAELAAQKRTALAMPPARAVRARFRIIGPDVRPDLCRYLQARLAALPGNPNVVHYSEVFQGPSGRLGWTGVQIWLAYPAADLPALLRTPKSAKTNTHQTTKRLIRFRGHRP